MNTACIDDASAQRNTIELPSTIQHITSIEGIKLIQDQLQSNRKRKQSNTGESQPLGGSFQILSQDDQFLYSALTARPLLLLPRASLPLAFVETNPIAHSEPRNALPRYFRGYISSLEESIASGETVAIGHVLVTSIERIDALFAIEQVRSGFYALCRLVDWVTLEDLGDGIRSRKKFRVADYSRGQYACQDEFPANTANFGHVLRPRKPLLDLKPSLSLSKANVSRGSRSSISEATNATKSTIPIARIQEVPNPFEDVPLPDLDETLANIKKQYLEALYISKTSLAYFAKGPLSRARALLTPSTLSTFSCAELITGLRACVLSKKMVDTKYRATVPDLVKELPTSVHSDNEDLSLESPLKARVQKARKRNKVAKNGLFPSEEEYLLRWHVQQNTDHSLDTTDIPRDERDRKNIGRQRAREIQLQIVLMLEVLSLEKTFIEKNGTLIDGEAKKQTETVTMPKRKKSQDLLALLDDIVERLCIWQTTNLEFAKSDNKTNKQEQSTKPKSASNLDGDAFEDFCTQVIVPFYATRLPEQTASICHKLGVSMGPSPKRPPLARVSSNSKSKSDTNADFNRQKTRPRKPLDRVLTDEKHGRQARAVPSLIRASTDSLLPTLKREDSAISLSSIPSHRTSKTLGKHFAQRQVDLTTISKATEAKLARKQAVEEEKDAAIATLKKPNARLAMKDLIESKELREAGSLGGLRKSKNPIRSAISEGVQVMATPKNNRRRDAYGDLPPLPPPRYETPSPLRPNTVPATSDSRIPSSSHKHTQALKPQVTGTPNVRLMCQTIPGSAVASRLQVIPVHKAIDCTPSKVKTISNLLQVPSSTHKSQLPSTSRSTALDVPSTPSKPRKRLAPTLVLPLVIETEEHAEDEEEMNDGPLCIITPLKTLDGERRIEPLGASGSTAPKDLTATRWKLTPSPSNETQKSIYASLGWDDDDIDELG
ncbi:hypothetical protein MMC25_007664 [Agyrium rufum]|nr:hypothetical protein [Agyrium rufum]